MDIRNISSSSVDMGEGLKYVRFEKYKEKQHKVKIEKANKLLADIWDVISTTHPEYLYLSPIFKIIEDESKRAAGFDFIALTEDEIRMLSEHSKPKEAELSGFKENIVDTILKLKAADFDREEKMKDEVTNGVISYLRFMLVKKCLNFLGSEHDIAYLQTLNQFVCRYGKEEDPAVEKYFCMAGEFLLAAAQILQKHLERRKCEYALNELRNKCLSVSRILLHELTMLTVAADERRVVETATIAELSAGMISDKEAIPPSIFKPWIQAVSKDYLAVSKGDSKLNSMDILPPEKIFIFANDRAELIPQAKKIANVFTILHKIIFLQYLAWYLIKNIKLLDEMYAGNPQRLATIFRVLDEMRQQIVRNIKQLQGVPNELQAILAKTVPTLEKYGKQITAYRVFLEKNMQPDQSKVKYSQSEMGVLANRLAKIYNIAFGPILLTDKWQSRVASKPQIEKQARKSLTLGTISEEKNVELMESPHFVIDEKTQLDADLNYMQQRIAHIEKVEQTTLIPGEIASYRRFYSCFNQLYEKYMMMIEEGGSSQQRSIKAAQMLPLLAKICRQGNLFLMGDAATRIREAGVFAGIIRDELTDSKNEFLDNHENALKHAVNEYSQRSIFTTISREKVQNMHQACDDIVVILKPRITARVC
jgi:hypothetical protein